MKKLPFSSLRKLLFIVLIGYLPVQVQAKEIVFAFDNTLTGPGSLDGMARTKMLINSMARADVKQAMFLIKTKAITPKTLERLHYYDQTGQLLVNAGHEFSLLHRPKNYAYAIDILKANAALEPYAHYYKHISYPFLHGYGDPQLTGQLRNFLAEHGYLPTYTTTYVHDEYMDHLYQLRIKGGRSVEIRQLEKAYINMVLDTVISYDTKARMRIGFSPRQVLVLHENDLAAYCVIGLIDALNEQGFNVIAPEKVFTDPVVNPYFAADFSGRSNAAVFAGLNEGYGYQADVASAEDKIKIHHYLQKQGLDTLIPQ